MTSLPLPLAHVLEEEDARLYGEDTPRERRWLVQESEIRNARSLAQMLAERIEKPPESISRWREANGTDPEYRKNVTAEINGILGSIAPGQWLFQHEAFHDADVKPYSGLGDASLFDPDEVFNLNRALFDGLFSREIESASDLRFSKVVQRIHARAKEGTPRSALSISGGGIRSATYALGVLQGLARRHVLEKFDFLSTISGGGYIGAWLSSWVRRDPWGIRGVCGQLSTEPNDPLVPEPQPIRHLRAYSNYLIPRLSAFSADTWALAATYFRNVLLNWLVLIPLLAGLLAVPRFLFTAVVHNPKGSFAMDLTSEGATIGFGIGILLLTFAFGALVVFRPVVETRTTRGFTDGKFIMRCLIPMLLAAVAFLLAWAWYFDSGGSTSAIDPVWFFAGGLFSTMGGFLVFLWRFLRTPFIQEPMAGKERRKRSAVRLIAELGGSLTAGLTGGLLSWLAARLFATPVEAISKVGVVRWPIADPGGLNDVTAAYVCLGVPVLLGILFLQAAIFVGASSHANHDFDREWWSRASGWVLLAGLGWMALSAIAIYGPVAIYHIPGLLSSAGGAAGLFSILAGRSDNTKGTEQNNAPSSMTSKATSLALTLAVPIFCLYILALISLGTTEALGWALNFESTKPEVIALETRQAAHASREYTAEIAHEPKAKIKEAPLASPEDVRSYEHLKIVETTPWGVALAIALGCPLIALAVSRCIGVNVFSMHAMYRDRLVRAYLGASRWSRQPNAFTGFDPNDNLPMHNLRPEYVWWHSFRDLDHAIGLLAAALDPRLQLISTELRRELGDELDHLFDAKTDRSIARPALYHSLNVLIATRDLAFLHDPANVKPAAEARRTLRNRRFVELAFGDGEVFPSPNPLFCAQDILSAKRFEDQLEHGTSAQANALRQLFQFSSSRTLDEINNVIVGKSLKDLPLFARTNDPLPFLFSDVDPIHRLTDNRLRLEAAFPGVFEPLRLSRPLHVVGMCLNLTGGEELAWQQRKGESFAVTPMTSGNYRLGYRDTRKYGDISLGTAVTISGAAASPNMGYQTSAPLAFLMTLFNVRLGWWLGNPGIAGNDTYERRNPAVSIDPLLRELTGNANDEYGYVYLSDGGHFDNLGLYEMVLRRVHLIVVSDGGADPKYAYDDLGNAIRKIRIDLGIEIELEEIGIIPPTEQGPGKYSAFGTIHYRRVDGPEAVDGKLLYIKPVVYKNEGPRDVLNYSTTSPTFPHESTANQFFTESQFESYRRLGLFAIDEICQTQHCEPMSVPDFIEKGHQYSKLASATNKQPAEQFTGNKLEG
jgi:hypothetical protein